MVAAADGPQRVRSRPNERYQTGAIYTMPQVNPADQRLPVEPIAIIGMACRFPGGANDLESFWRLLIDGVDASSDIPRERWDVDLYHDPLRSARGKSYVRRASFLQGIDVFSFDAD